MAAAVSIAAITIGVWSATGFTADFVLTAGFGIGLVAFFAGLVFAFVFYVLAASHLKRTFNTLAQKSGEASFSTAGTLLWIGSILTIIRCRLNTDIHCLDICNNWILHNEIPSIPTIHPATKQLWLHPAVDAARATKEHGNQQKRVWTTINLRRNGI